MDRRDEARRVKKAAAGPVALFFLWAFVSGCTTPVNQVAGGDPLFGETQPRSGGSAPAPTTAPMRTQAQVPPITTTGFTNTNAALASANPLPGSRPLAIPDNRTPPGPANNPSQVAANPKPAPPKVMPLPREGSPPNPGLLASAPASAQQSTSVVNDLQAALRARGVLFQKQDPVPEGVRFQCIVLSKQNPDTTRVFETTARDYITAVQAVLKQIDEQR